MPRSALRRNLSALSGGVSRTTPWRRRPLAFLCYVLSVSTLRPLANRVREAAGWRLIGQRGRTVCRRPHLSSPLFLSFCLSCSSSVILPSSPVLHLNLLCEALSSILLLIIDWMFLWYQSVSQLVSLFELLVWVFWHIFCLVQSQLLICKQDIRRWNYGCHLLFPSLPAPSSSPPFSSPTCSLFIYHCYVRLL